MSTLSLRQRLLVGFMLSLSLVLLAAGVAEFGSERRMLQRMSHAFIQADMTLHEINKQAAQTLATMDALITTPNQCDAELYAQIAQRVAASRFIYEAAVLRSDGFACSSYGREIKDLPNKNDPRHYVAMGFDYWFLADSSTSADNGFIVVAHGENFVWLNKGIVLSALGLETGAAFSIVDTQRHRFVFANASQTIDFAHLPAPGALSFESQVVHYALPTQWPGLISVFTLPRSAYQNIWWSLFALTFISSGVVLVVLFLLPRWIRHRYFSVVPKLRQALKHNRLQLHYQPIVSLQNSEWVGVESLLRWPGSNMKPGEFIAAAERAGMGSEVSRWVVRRMAEEYSQFLWACKGLYITINLTAQDLEDESFADFVRDLLGEYQVPAHLIIFEVTEHSLVNREQARIQLQRLRDQGHRIALDDFGTGYSSLSYLGELPVDILKMDRSFLEQDKMQADDALWRHIVGMAGSLNLTLVAEGIEHIEQAELLRREGVHFAQGWLYSKALPASVLAKRFFLVRKMD